MPKTIVITQSNYIPWRGYFDLMRQCDEFILGDSVQYTHKDWRNRNRIKTTQGPLWLTVPVESAGTSFASLRIEEARIADPRWAKLHLKTLHHAYNKAPHYKETMAWLAPLYEEAADESRLSLMNERLLGGIAGRLGLQTPIVRTGAYFPAETLDGLDRTERIIRICRAAGAGRYLSGPAARAYLNAAAMAEAGIEVAWMDYSRYAPYPQLWGDFDPAVSIVDLLVSTGPGARDLVAGAGGA